MSRMSTAAVAVNDVSGVHLPSDDRVADASRTSVAIDVSLHADVSLPPVPDVAVPAPIDDVSFHAGSSIVEPLSVARADDFGDDTAFNETLRSATADITLFAVSLSLVHITVCNKTFLGWRHSKLVVKCFQSAKM